MLISDAIKFKEIFQDLHFDLRICSERLEEEVFDLVAIVTTYLELQFELIEDIY